MRFSQNINLFVGQNNAGKSTILNSILSLQKPNSVKIEDISIGNHEGRINIYFKDVESYRQNLNSNLFPHQSNQIVLEFKRIDYVLLRDLYHNGENVGSFSILPDQEPENLIYPYLSKRKVVNYRQQVRRIEANSLTGNLENLPAKIVRISNSSNPHNAEYLKACEQIIGFPVSFTDAHEGHDVAYLISNNLSIPITSMGEGVANLVGLIEQLCVAENKIFIIEEPESDIHPKQLKALLSLIEEKSQKNQFFISTHSNIVTKYLGSIPNSKVFKVKMSFNEKKLPVSSVEEVPNEETARRELLEELGYEFQDYDLHKAWLFLEESSAEVVIRDFLIPNFAKKLLGKLKTFSANGIDKVKPKLDDFNKLFVFLNLQPIYKNRVWVLIDGGSKEEIIINEMKEMYSKNGWDKDKFMQLKERNFEMYYPKSFNSKVGSVLSIEDKGLKRERKKHLIEEVKQWWKVNPEQAKAEFSESAKEIIDILRKIEKQII